MAELHPNDADSMHRFREIVGGAVDVMIGRRLPDSGTVDWHAVEELPQTGWSIVKALLRNSGEGEELPAVLLQPESWNKSVTIWITPEGKQSLFQEDGSPRPQVQRLLDAGVAVLGVDLFGQGEFTTDGKPLLKQRLNESGRGDWAGYAGYTYGYNHPMFSQRVHDILSAISAVQAKLRPQHVYLAGMNGAGHWAAAALAQAGDAVDRAAIDTGGFRFTEVQEMDHADFLPGGAKYLDLPGMLALCAPKGIWIAGEGPEAPSIVAEAYRAEKASQRLTTFGGDRSESISAAVKWLLR
jgi:hypothetical protein